MRLKIIVLLLMMLYAKAYSQQDYGTLLQNLKVAIKNDTNKVIALNQLGTYFLESRSDSALIYSNKALKLSDSLKYNAGIAYAYLNMANHYNGASNFNVSINYYLQSMRLYESLNNKKAVCILLNNIANSYQGMSKPNLAIAYFKKSNLLAKEINHRVMIAVSGVGIGNYLLDCDSALKALDYFKEANLFFKEHETNTYRIGATYILIADAETKLKRYNEAQANLLKALKIFETLDNSYGLASAKMALGELQFNQKKYNEAELSLIEAIKLFKLTDGSTDIKNAALILSNVCLANGKPKEALDYFKLHTSIKDSIQSNEINKQIIDVSTKYETEKKEQKNALLLAQNTIAKQTIKQQRFSFYIMVGGLILVIIFTFFIFRGLRLQRKTNKTLEHINKKLEEKNKIIEDKTTALQKALGERELLLKEIHHRVKNNLQIISGLLELQKEELTEEGSKAAFDEGQSRVRSISLIHQNLYQNENLGSVEFRTFLLELINQVKEVFESHDRIMEVTLEIPNQELDIDTAVPLGLIINELLTNSYKYASVKNSIGKINIKIESLTHGNHKLIYFDSGPGIKEEINFDRASSMGLRLIKGLAGQLAGQASYSNQNGSVFTIIFKDAEARRKE